MTWKPRPIKPWRPPFNANGRTYDPKLVLETSLFRDALTLVTSPVWQKAPLTRLAREALPDRLGRGWHVRHVGGTEPIALVLHIMAHDIDGGVVSAAPERVSFAYSDRLLVVTPDIVIRERGREERLAFRHLGDVIVGTRPVRRRRAPPIPPVDIDALIPLAP